MQSGLTEITSITNGLFDDYEGTVGRWYAGEIDRINNGETIAEGLERFNRTIEDIALECAGLGTIAVVAHANILSHFTAQYEARSALDLHHIIAMPDIATMDWESKSFDTKFGDFK